jgi:hypothetical protein
VKVQPETLDIVFLRALHMHIVFMDPRKGGGHVSLRAVNLSWTVAFILYFLN